MFFDCGKVPHRLVLSLTLLFLSLFTLLSSAIRVINNGLAPPEIVHRPLNIKPRCLIKAAPLDLVFILDSSGSLRNQFQDEVDVIRRIVRHVTIGETATRVMLIQFSGVQHLEFDFNKFTHRDDLVSALDVLRHVSGITRVGGAFEFATSVLANATHGIRPPAVPKIVFLLSDGRTHDFPTDSEMAEKLRNRIANLDIWAYGTGEYVAMSELVKITKNESKIITNKNLNNIEPLFGPWHGVEVCEQRPECVKGSDKPLDLAILLDSSESINQVFQEQIQFAVERVLPNIHVHPNAVRLALITFSGRAFLHFGFDDTKMGNNSAVTRYLNTLRPIKGTTSAHLAISAAIRLFNDPIQNNFPKRPNASKLALIFSDGRVSEPIDDVAEMLRSTGVEVVAVSLNHQANTDERELLAMTGQKSENVFTQKNLQEFEKTFLKFVGFGCEGIELGQNSTPRIRGATDISCGPDSLTVTVRTQRPMKGLMYAHQFQNDPLCVLRASGESRESTLTVRTGQCGLQRTPLRHSSESGYMFNVTIVLQFHPIIVTRADQGLDVSCVHHQPVSQQEMALTSSRHPLDFQCSYRLHRFGPDHCIALDAKVGESLFHKWECEMDPEHLFLVHDCYASSGKNNVLILNEKGCETDAYFIETPDYTQLVGSRNTSAGAEINSNFVSQGMSAFKFPGEDNLIFRCSISFCDMTSTDECIQMIPPKCPKSTTLMLKEEIGNGPMPISDNDNTNKNNKTTATTIGGTDEEPKVIRVKREGSGRGRERGEGLQQTKNGFTRTMGVETRTLNVIESEGIRPPQATVLRYCDVRN